jgi:phosphomannomutase/phosphoglucomutase
MPEVNSTAEYRCPGEQRPISRSVHLGRLARFDPACWRCPHGSQTGTFSSRLVRQLSETRARGRSRERFHAEGAGGVYLNEFDPAAARQMAAALGVCLRRHRSDASEPLVAVVAGDGRPLAAELVAAVAEGLRWAGCGVVDVGAASAPCLALAIHHLGCDGGILVGNFTHRQHHVGLKFWRHGGQPLSLGGWLDDVKRAFETGTDRPARKAGSLGRFQAGALYLDALRPHYHALRPLRWVLDTSCRPLARYLDTLLSSAACEIIPCPAPDKLPGLVDAEQAHFGVRVDDDGERCCVWDEGGRPVATGQLFLLVARHLFSEPTEHPVVLEEETEATVASEIRRWGGRVTTSRPSRAATWRAMVDAGASIGGGSSGRIWYRSAGGHCSADALMTLTLLVQLLSQSDRPLSAVLDAGLPLR